MPQGKAILRSENWKFSSRGHAGEEGQSGSQCPTKETWAMHYLLRILRTLHFWLGCHHWLPGGTQRDKPTFALPSSGSNRAMLCL